MNLHQALDWRYAVREFGPDTIDDQTLHSLLDATRKSASSYGLQPYKLIVINNPALRDDLVAASYGQEKVRDSSHLIVFAAETDIGDHTVDQYIAQHIRIRGTSYEEIQGYAEHMKQALAVKTLEQAKEWARQQAYIALGTFLTGAAMLAVDACPMTGFVQQQYDQILGLDKQGLTATAIAAIGRRSEDDKSATAPKVRRNFEDFVEFRH